MKYIFIVLGVIALQLVNSEVFSLAIMSVLVVAGLIAILEEFEKKGDDL